MKMQADYHIHTVWCGHATGDIEKYVLRAIELGIPEIGFSEHLPINVPIDEKVCPTPDEWQSYLAQVREMQPKFAGRIAIRLGGEADYIPGHEKTVERIKTESRLEYLIGSVHFLDGWAFDHPAHVSGFDTRSVDAVYRDYFGVVAEAARTGLFDIIGHFDLPKKFGHRPNGRSVSLAAEAIAALADTGTAFEINTAGKDKPVGEFYPCNEIIAACRQAGVKLSFGSDSHAPEQIGRYFPAARQLAAAAGYRHTLRMDPHRSLVPLCD